MRFHILVFGCQMNYADSARIRAVLTNCGFSYTEKSKEADIIIFDTCSIKQKAEDKITGKFKTIRPDQKIRITGCMIQHNLRQGKMNNDSSPNGGKGKIKVGNFLGSIKNIDPKVVGLSANEVNLLKSSDKSSAIIPINNVFNPIFHNLTQKWKNIELMRRIDDTGFLPLMLKKLNYEIAYDKELINEYEKIIPENIATSMNTHKKTAYIPISTGCNQFCAYCIVPYARGLEKNFAIEQVVEEAKVHLKNGAEEIVLIGQIVNKHPDFISIVKKILKLKGLKRLRYTSPYPTYYSKELLALHEKEKKLCPHIHIPLQSGSDEILKKMFRGYTVKQAKGFIDAIKKLKRKISITTDIIVGFPGETEDDFQQSLNLVKYGSFDMVYIGIYSPRPGTFAEKKYPDNISRIVKRDRRNGLNDVLKEISLKNNKQEIGTIREVLVNKIGILKDGEMETGKEIYGYTDNMKQIIIQSPAVLEGKELKTKKSKKGKSTRFQVEPKIGEFIKVKITKAIPFKLYGEIVP